MFAFFSTNISELMNFELSRIYDKNGMAVADLLTKAGEPVTAYTLKNSNGMSVTILDYGCTIQSLIVPDKWTKPIDVVLGYKTVEEYENNTGFLGAFIGRVGNRIGKGTFDLNGKTYHLVQNDNGNH